MSMSQRCGARQCSSISKRSTQSTFFWSKADCHILCCTFVAALCVLCGCRTEYSSRGRAFALNLLAALIQTLTAPFVVGWVWSIMWSVTCVNISRYISRLLEVELVPLYQECAY
ncbi:hypothetical protein BIW11_06234 [Tropilaelaps mercedesae]|uniref:Uncharacterized protein n=1 Tax=Tropilaelaps mercedesae TaxID=418985 RepID=A0A1V9XZ00_9ACAR|nr:hypothetical protein BIW11_06234 [Tropilaelaps mercedesae]